MLLVCTRMYSYVTRMLLVCCTYVTRSYVTRMYSCGVLVTILPTLLSLQLPVDGEYEPEKYGAPQIDNVDLDVLGLFTSRTDKACL